MAARIPPGRQAPVPECRPALLVRTAGACASIAYGLRWHVGDEDSNCAHCAPGPLSSAIAVGDTCVRIPCSLAAGRLEPDRGPCPCAVYGRVPAGSRGRASHSRGPGGWPGPARPRHRRPGAVIFPACRFARRRVSRGRLDLAAGDDRRWCSARGGMAPARPSPAIGPGGRLSLRLRPGRSARRPKVLSASGWTALSSASEPRRREPRRKTADRCPLNWWPSSRPRPGSRVRNVSSAGPRHFTHMPK